MKPKNHIWLRALSVSLVTVSAAHAQVNFTNSTPDSDYSTAANWSPARVPTGTDEAYIGDAANTPRSVVYSSATGQTTSGRFIIGYGATGSLKMKAGSGTLQFGGNDYSSANYVGVGGGNGTLTIEGGTLKLDNGLASGGASLGIGTNNPGSNGTLNVSGGLVDIVGGRLMAGLNNIGSTSVINLSGSGVINVGVASTYADRGRFRIGTGTNTVNLDGGTLALAQFDTTAADGGRSNVYFNGGTIKALAASADFITGNSVTTGTGANFQMKNGGLTFDTNTFDVTIADTIRQVSGQTGKLTKTGTGTLTLAASMEWTGGTTVDQGTLKFGFNDVFGNASSSGQALTANTGTIITNETTFTTVSALTLKNATLTVTGGASATYQGFKLRDSVTATGNAVIDSNTSSNAFNQIHLGANADGTSTTFNVVGNADTLAISAVLRNGVTGTGGAVVTTGLIKTGAGIMTLTGANSYAGGTTVNAGTLTVGTGGTLGANTGALAVNNANVGAATAVILNLATAVDTIVGSLSGTVATPSSGSNSATINNGGSGRNFTVNQTTDGSYAGVIDGAGSLTIGSLSTSALTLSGTNSYTGATTVKAGKLYVTGNISTSALATVESGATIGGTGNLGAITVDAGGVIAPGTIGLGNLTISGDLTIAGTYSWQLGALTTTVGNYDTLTMTSGAANISGASLALDLGSYSPSADPFWTSNQTWFNILENSGAGALSGNFTAINNPAWVAFGSFATATSGNDVNLVWTAVPEPATALMSLLGFAGLLRRRR